MKSLSSLLFILVCSFFPKAALGHYEILNPKTTLTELTFDMVHRYMPGHDTTHFNTCRLPSGKTTLKSCKLAYDFFLASNNTLVKTEYIELRGDGSYDKQLTSAPTHYSSLKVAEAHGINLTQHVSIPYSDISTLAGSDGQFRVETYSEGVSCVGTSNCQTSKDSNYVKHTVDLSKGNLDVACEVSLTSLGGGNIEKILSGEHIYLHNSNASRFSQNIGPVNMNVNCVNWLPLEKSKKLIFSITPNTVLASGGDTAVTCGAYKDNNSKTAPGYSISRDITVPGFEGFSNTYPTDNIYYGIYVSSPSSSAEKSLVLECALQGDISIGS